MRFSIIASMFALASVGMASPAPRMSALERSPKCTLANYSCIQVTRSRSPKLLQLMQKSPHSRLVPQSLALKREVLALSQEAATLIRAALMAVQTKTAAPSPTASHVAVLAAPMTLVVLWDASLVRL